MWSFAAAAATSSKRAVRANRYVSSWLLLQVAGEYSVHTGLSEACHARSLSMVWMCRGQVRHVSKDVDTWETIKEYQLRCACVGINLGCTARNVYTTGTCRTQVSPHPRKVRLFHRAGICRWTAARRKREAKDRGKGVE